MAADIRLVPPLNGGRVPTEKGRRPFPKPLASRHALVCAGGGITGAIYEMGALAAVEDRLEGRSLADFDMFVGISAGSYVGSLVASGVSPSVLFRLVTRAEGRSDLDDLNLFRPNLSEIRERLRDAPATLLRAAWDYWTGGGETTLTDLVASLSSVLPSGFLVLDGMEAWLRTWLSQPGRTDDFRQLKNKLRVVAVELDTGQTAAFGGPGLDHVPISRAVAASCALPGLYRPIRVDGVDYVDGGVKKTSHLSLALRERCGLVLCVNPIVPLWFSPEDSRDPGSERGALASSGFFSILDQVFRLTLHSRLQYGLARYRRECPAADILVFEPRPEDLPRVMRNIMRTSGRVRIAEYAYRTTMQQLDEDYARYSRIFQRHGLRLRPATALPRRTADDARKASQPQTSPARERLLESLRRLERVLATNDARPA